jgi:hypothetical protein
MTNERKETFDGMGVQAAKSSVPRGATPFLPSGFCFLFLIAKSSRYSNDCTSVAVRI